MSNILKIYSHSATLPFYLFHLFVKICEIFLNVYYNLYSHSNSGSNNYNSFSISYAFN